MIPKIIHYCWFGKKKKDTITQRYINAWKEKLKDYQFIEWNEDNFDVNEFDYTREAYNEKKYAFVSDVARIKALYEYGGIYLDTDIEIKRDFTNLLNEYNLILGYEANGKHIMTAFMAAEKKHFFIEEILKIYKNIKFKMDNGELDLYPNTYRITELLKGDEIKINGKECKIYGNGIIFPEIYFSAMNFENLEECSNANTYTVHHFNSSWKPWYVKIRRKIKICFLRCTKIFRR